MSSLFKRYYVLTKPGIVRGNALAAMGGFLLASRGTISWPEFAAMSVGISLVIASACVFNNFLDRDIDKRMQRTKKRALVTGDISVTSALVYASVLGAAGTVVLFLWNNPLAAFLALFGHFAYVVLYGIGKRTTVYGTLIGSISGAVPPVVGYVAVTNQLDLGALLLFVIMTAWQMPHFYAISIYRKKDYASAKLPVMSVVRGIEWTKREIIGYIAVFAVTTVLLTAYGYTGVAYLVAMLLVSLWWLFIALKGYRAKDSDRWAKQVFGGSLVVLLAFSLMISITAYLP